MVTNRFYITTIGGRSFDPLSPEMKDIDVGDIAHSLSLICRANGHFRQFFSVGRHCINCAREAEARGFSARQRLLCLLHDATEAYIGDMTRPLERFAIPRESEAELRLVGEIDDCMLYHEFLLFNGDALYETPPTLHIDIAHSEREFSQTKAEFLALFEKLMTEAGYKC